MIFSFYRVWGLDGELANRKRGTEQKNNAIGTFSHLLLDVWFGNVTMKLTLN